jgi:6-phosphogluconolactonase
VIQEVIKLPNEREMAGELARRFHGALSRARAENRRAAIALTGGASARLYAAMNPTSVDWREVELFWSDERAVPPDHPDANFHAARELFINQVAISSENVHRMPADEADLEAAAIRYERMLPPRFDLIHLGMGSDGHVCSLFPGHALLAERRRGVRIIEDAPKPPPRRMTFTLPVLHMARAIVLTVIGPGKAHAVRDVLENPASSLPAALVAQGPAPTTILVASPAAD